LTYSIRVALTLVMVVGLAAGCAKPPPTQQYPADISGRVTITDTLLLFPWGERLAAPENMVFWFVDISVKTSTYGRSITTTSRGDWAIVAGNSVYPVADLIRLVGDPSPSVDILLGETGHIITGFSVPARLRISDALIRYEGQEPYSYGKLSGGTVAAAYDWDSKKPKGTTLWIFVVLLVLAIGLIIFFTVNLKHKPTKSQTFKTPEPQTSIEDEVKRIAKKHVQDIENVADVEVTKIILYSEGIYCVYGIVRKHDTSHMSHISSTFSDAIIAERPFRLRISANDENVAPVPTEYLPGEWIKKNEEQSHPVDSPTMHSSDSFSYPSMENLRRQALIDSGLIQPSYEDDPLGDIRDSLERIEDRRDRAVLVCPSCGATLTSGSKFCMRCGKEIPSATTCPSCGALIPEGAKFCGQCGKACGE